MTMQGGGRVLRGVAGVAGLLGATAGIPVGLVALGQPFPVSTPGWAPVADALHRPLSDAGLLRAAGVLCWLVWAAFVVALLIEVTGQVFGSGVRIGVPVLQPLARTMILTAALLMPQRAALAAAPAAVIVVHHPAPAHAEPDDRQPAVRPPTVRYVVRHYDSPWAIAEHHLGDGTRWRELQDVEGRSLVRPGGARIIHPGEVLLIPAEGPAAVAHRAPLTAPTAPSPREPLPAEAQAAVAHQSPLKAQTAPSPREPLPAEAPAAVAHRAPLTAPTAPSPREPVPAPVPAPVPPAPVPTASTTTAGPPVEILEVSSESQAATSAPAVAALLEAGLVGAATLCLLRVLRQRQAQRRPAGRRVRLPGPELAREELAIRTAEAPDRVALAGSAIDLLAETLHAAGTTPPGVLGVLVDDDAVEVLLDRPAPPPPPWIATAEGFRWRIAARAVEGVEAAPAGRSAPLPALTSLGRAAAGDADVLINLEAAGLVRIAGPRDRAVGVLHAMATHLCGAPWAGAVDLVLIGLAPDLAPIDRARTAPSIAAVRDSLQATTEVLAATMARHGCADALAGRVRGVAGDGWPPLVVLSAAPMTADEWAWLATLTAPGSGVAAVVAGSGDPARWVIDAGASPMPVDPLRLAVQPTVLDQAAMAAIGRLLEIAGDDSGATLADPPYDRIELGVERAAGFSSTHRLGGRQRGFPQLADPEILVRVLGTVDVDGAATFKRAKARELIVYLAMHPHGVGESELDEALWPSNEARVVSASTRDSTVSVARRAIGGPGRLLPALGQGREKRYQLGPDVQSDWDRFCVQHRWGRDHSSTEALRMALEAVRGRPFEGVASGRTYGWIHTEGHGRHIEAEVGDAADLAAGLYLAAGDPVGARWAARRGLMADPYTERLWVRLMEAADQLGESQEIERVMDELDVVLELEGDFSGLHPNTLSVYDRLSRRHRYPAAR